MRPSACIWRSGSGCGGSAVNGRRPAGPIISAQKQLSRISKRHDDTSLVLYTRVSSGRQYVDQPIAAQKRALRDYCSKDGYGVIHEYVDEAGNGRIASRLEIRRRWREPHSVRYKYRTSQRAYSVGVVLPKTFRTALSRSERVV